MAPLARALLHEQRQQRSRPPVEATHRITISVGGQRGWVLRETGVLRQAASLLQRAAIGPDRAPFIARPECRHGYHDQSRIDLGQHGIVQPEFGQHLGRVVLDDDIGLGHQIEQDRTSLSTGQIERDAQLVAVHQRKVRVLFVQLFLIELIGVMRAPPPVRIARAFHLDDFRAKVRQRPCRQWPGPPHRQIHHADFS
ncbi:hypothetical protein D3C87_1367610 [compost metagenome]